MSVRPSVCIEQLGSNQTDFNEILYLSTFQKSAEKLKFYQNLIRIIRT